MGKVVMDGGPYDEADEADRKELIEIRTEESKANAERRRLAQRSNGGRAGLGDTKSCAERSIVYMIDVYTSYKN